MEKKITERVQRFNAALTGEGFSFDEDNLGAYLNDEEGERLCRLSSYFVESVEAVSPEGIAEILKTVYLAHIGRNEQSFKAGHHAGRAQVINTIHELLGITKLRQSLADIESAMSESH